MITLMFTQKTLKKCLPRQGEISACKAVVSSSAMNPNRPAESILRGSFRFLTALLLILALLLSCSLAEEADISIEEIVLDEEELTEYEELPEDARSLLATDTVYHTPNEHSEILCDHDVCFWKMNMGEMDEAAIWRVLTQPVTVLEGKQREQVRVLARPDPDCTDYTGVLTCTSQAVHILDLGEEWTLIEAYSSAEEGSAVHVFAERFQGYVKTERLKTEEVDQTYGLVIDKLQQRLYVFKEGRLFSTLLCSTGFARKDTPFAETPAGEFLVVSWTGGFWAGSLFCDMGMRINSGILIHEVPCLMRTNESTGETYRDYARCERYLGEKASHGCIRVQKELTPEGVNAKWLWDNLNRKPYTKVIIWDDAGRELGYPDDSLPLYYNPKGGKNYHSQPTCRLVSDKYEPMPSFTYAELEDKPYRKLSRCPGCAPQLRKSEIETVNEKNNR